MSPNNVVGPKHLEHNFLTWTRSHLWR